MPRGHVLGGQLPPMPGDERGGVNSTVRVLRHHVHMARRDPEERQFMESRR
ncbi:hypothetical protein [Microbacterium sp. P04]|uniref:hypothetical protein n=1 Tax=Microbacterium sp. P04 TaxID=3366947 RepID=UPI003744D3B6